jgi:hypothetical protein
MFWIIFVLTGLQAVLVSEFLVLISLFLGLFRRYCLLLILDLLVLLLFAQLYAGLTVADDLLDHFLGHLLVWRHCTPFPVRSGCFDVPAKHEALVLRPTALTLLAGRVVLLVLQVRVEEGILHKLVATVTRSIDFFAGAGVDGFFWARHSHE